MSKLCVKCGAALEDTAMFCNICGAQQSAPQQPVYQQPAPQQPKKELKLDKKKIITIGGIAAAVILVVVLLFVLIPPAGSGAVDTYFEVYYEGNTDNFEDLLPESMWEYYEDKVKMSIGDCQEQAEEEAKENKKDNKKYYGSDYEFSYKVLDTYELDESDVNKLASKLQKRYGKKYLNKDDVDAIKIIWAQVTEEGKKDKDIWVAERAVIKIDGEWYLGYVYRDENGKYSEFWFEASFYNDDY